MVFDAPFLLILLVCGGVLAVLIYPFLGRREPWNLNESPDRLRTLKRARDRALRTLKDLENDYREGSLREAEFQELRAAYKQEAIRLSKELSRVRETVIRQISGGPGKPLEQKERQVLEKIIAGRRNKDK